MPLPDLLPIRPFTRPARGEVTLPGSKSITNRALLLAALCEGPVTLTGALFSEDTEFMAETLNRLGIAVKSDPVAKTFHVVGQAGNIPAPSADLFVGNAGTAARFLTALCAAAKSGTYYIDGVPQMRKRPMKGLIDALRSLGANIRCTGEEGFFPLEIHARGLRDGEVRIDASESSQMLSAMLMAAPLANGEIRIIVTDKTRWAFVEMTRRIMDEFGVKSSKSPLTFEFIVKPDTYTSPGNFVVEPDASAASYYLALPLVIGGTLRLPGLRPVGLGLQGDARFAEIVEFFKNRQNAEDSTHDFRDFSDTFLTLAAITPLLEGTTKITGIAHTRKQETDRVAGMAAELKKLGQGVVEEHDALTITPDLAALRRAADAAPGGIIEIETHHDHRFAMSFGILGCYNLRGDGSPWLAIRNPACCAKTFPNFFEVLEKVRITSHPDEPAHPSSSS